MPDTYAQMNEAKIKEETTASAIIDDTPVVTINGREYRLNRLSVRHTFRIARILAQGAAALGSQVNNMQLDSDTMITLLVAGFPFAETECLHLLADLVGVSVQEIQDPNKFPMGSELEIVAALAKHQDMRAFLDRLGKLIKMLPEAQQQAARPAASNAE